MIVRINGLYRSFEKDSDKYNNFIRPLEAMGWYPFDFHEDQKEPDCGRWEMSLSKDIKNYLMNTDPERTFKCIEGDFIDKTHVLDFLSKEELVEWIVHSYDNSNNFIDGMWWQGERDDELLTLQYVFQTIDLDTNYKNANVEKFMQNYLQNYGTTNIDVCLIIPYEEIPQAVRLFEEVYEFMMGYINRFSR